MRDFRNPIVVNVALVKFVCQINYKRKYNYMNCIVKYCLRVYEQENHVKPTSTELCSCPFALVR